MKYFTFLNVALAFFHLGSFAQEKINILDSKGLKQGKWTGTYESGVKRYEGNFTDNYPVNTFIHYYESGEKSAEIVFSEKGKKAKAKYFHLNGMVKGKGSYSDQKKDSTWLYYDDREILSSEENFILGKREGISKVFFLDGSVAEETNWKNDAEHGQKKQFFHGGKPKYEANYLDGNPDGKVIFYHPNGQTKSTGIYRFAVKNGEWISYNEDGTVFTIETYDKGILTSLKKENGLFLTNYPGGNPKEEFFYKHGMKNGGFKEYFDKPVVTVTPIDTSKPDTLEPEELYIEKTMFEGGPVIDPPRIKVQGNYLDDKYDGEVTYFYLSGEIEKVEIYKNGELLPGLKKSGTNPPPKKEKN